MRVLTRDINGGRPTSVSIVMFALVGLSLVCSSTQTDAPILSPTLSPTVSPTSTTSPTVAPTLSPSASPSMSPTSLPSAFPTALPSKLPSQTPSSSTPTTTPIVSPTTTPTMSSPTLSPTLPPTNSFSPSLSPTATPTRKNNTIVAGVDVEAAFGTGVVPLATARFAFNTVVFSSLTISDRQMFGFAVVDALFSPPFNVSVRSVVASFLFMANPDDGSLFVAISIDADANLTWAVDPTTSALTFVFRSVSVAASESVFCNSGTTCEGLTFQSARTTTTTATTIPASSESDLSELAITTVFSLFGILIFFAVVGRFSRVCCPRQMKKRKYKSVPSVQLSGITNTNDKDIPLRTVGYIELEENRPRSIAKPRDTLEESGDSPSDLLQVADVGVDEHSHDFRVLSVSRSNPLAMNSDTDNDDHNDDGVNTTGQELSI